ncbi:hypothetical protein B0X67_07740 [Helicobacter pylori]|nr:hypothetical protein BZK27_03985 [Helicobacter pylori]OOQ24950.1 hypothetical protein B0X67_07740 [Helicobacter pylori]
MLGGFSSVLYTVLSVGVIALFVLVSLCVISLSSLKLFSVSFVCSLFSFSFHSQTPLFRKLQKLKMR